MQLSFDFTEKKFFKKIKKFQKSIDVAVFLYIYKCNQ